MLLSRRPLESLIFFASRILSTKSSLLDLTSNRYTPSDLFFCCVINKISRPPTFCGHSSSLTPQVDGEHGNSSTMYKVVTLVTEKRISTSSFDRWIRDYAAYKAHAVHIPSPTCSFCYTYISIRLGKYGISEANSCDFLPKVFLSKVEESGQQFPDSKPTQLWNGTKSNWFTVCSLYTST